MRRSRTLRILGALAGPSAILFSIAVACEPQDIYLFDQDTAGLTEDAGSEQPEQPEPEQPELEPDAAPPARVQPRCDPDSEACEECVERDACSSPGAVFFCHPVTGECELACDPETDAQVGTCLDDDRCEPSLGLCVECLGNDDCADGALRVCNTQRGECVECVGSLGCTSDRPVCVPDTSTCVECQFDVDCPGGSVCLDQSCVQCRDNTDCTSGDDNLCLPGQQICVECVTGADCVEVDPSRPFCSSEYECEDEDE